MQTENAGREHNRGNGAVAAMRLLPYLALLFAASVLQYSLSLGNGFVWDAEIAFTQDPTIRELKYLPLGFQEPTLRHLPTEGVRVTSLDYYRPLIKVLHVLEFQWFGEDPTGYKALNVVLNATVVSLLFLFALLATHDPRAAFIAAVLYAVNPTRAEAVYWTYSDSYIVVSLFALAALLLYQRRHLLAAFGAFALALLSHEMAVLLPVIVFLYAYLVEERRGLRAYVPACGFVLVAAGYLMLRAAVIGTVPLAGVDAITFLNTTSVVIQRYAKVFFVPDALVTIYPNELFSGISGEVVLSHVVGSVLIALGVLLWAKCRNLLFWYLWFFVWLAVSFNIGEFGQYLMAEKILYFASAGWCVLIALLATGLPRRRVVAYALIAVLAVFHSAHVFARAPYWKGTRPYLEKALEFAPGFFLAHYALGNAYVKVPDLDRALEQFALAIEVEPGLSLAHNNMGNIYFLRSDLDRAISAWERAIANDPTNPMPYYNIGLALEKKGDLTGALTYLEKYVATAPEPVPGAVHEIQRLRALTR